MPCLLLGSLGSFLCAAVLVLTPNLCGATAPQEEVRRPTAVPDLIKRTCNSTAYFDLCVSSLRSDPGSAKADVRGLSAIAVNLAISNATGTSGYASRLAKRRGKADAALGSALGGCARWYADAGGALGSALDALARQDYDYASVDVGAAAGYAEMCRNSFGLSRAAAYPAEMARREEALERLCSIAQDIISLLG